MGDPPEARTALVHIEAEPRAWLAKAAVAAPGSTRTSAGTPHNSGPGTSSTSSPCVTPSSRTRRRRWRTRAPRARSRPWAR